MSTTPQQEFYFHADATSIGGYIDSPKGPALLPTPCSVSLSSAGGSAQNVSKEFSFAGEVTSGIKVASASTQVTGQPVSDGWIQRVTNVVQGLDIFGVVTADSLVGQITTHQPFNGPRRITFSGSNVSNLKINGRPVTISFEESLAPAHTRTAVAYNQTASPTPDLEWSALNTLAINQSKALGASKNLPAWASHRYGWIGTSQGMIGHGGYTLCSLVNNIGGETGGQSFGHCIDLPGFGRVCLAEIVVHSHSANLTMVRAELDGKQCGRTAVCMLYTNATMWPPN